MFPSFLPHIVHLVTSGVRQSIVGWFKGEWAEKAALDIKGRWPDRHAAVHDAHAWLNATFADHGRLSLGIAQTHELALQHVDDIRYQQSVLAVGLPALRRARDGHHTEEHRGRKVSSKLSVELGCSWDIQG